MFWPDETRFEVSRRIAGSLLEGRLGHAADLLFGHPDHLLFKVAGLVPAGLAVIFGSPAWVSGLFFAAASTWVLWLIGRVARTAGGSETEGLVALILAACTTSLFYYSRHFFPYDLALGLFLLCLLAGLREATTARNSLLAGLWAGLGYLTYNGYWSLGAVLLVAHVLLALPQPRAMATRVTYSLLGLVLPVFAATLLSRLFGHDFFTLTVSFAGTADQGELDRAWEFLGQYFWNAEHGLAILWALTLLMSLDRTGRPAGVRAFLWPGLSLTLGTLLVVPPEYFHHFAVTARHSRVLAPFLCLTAAAALCGHARLREQPRLLVGLLGLVVLQAGFNFATPLAQLFPHEFEQLAVRRLAEARKTDPGPYKIINAAFLHNPNWAPLGPDPGVVVLRRNHPFQFAPYLFDGYSFALRAGYLERDLSMRVVRLDVGGPPHGGYPEGSLELTLRFPEKPEGLLPEPILSTGVPGRGDTIFIHYLGLDRFVLGHDHVGGGATFAPPQPLDRTRLHRVLIGMDSFFPPGSLGRAPQRFVVWNDTVLLHGRAELHPTAADQITIGHNFIGTSTATSQLSAEIVGYRRIPAPRLGPVFARPPGAVQLEMLLPPEVAALHAQPLLSSGPPGGGDLLYLRHEGNGLYRLGCDQWGGRGALLSEPLAIDSSRSVKFTIAMGSFFPPAAPDPLVGYWSRRLYVSCNDQVVFNRAVAFRASTPGELGLGANLTGSTAAATKLSADMLRCEVLPLDKLPAEPTGYPGAVRLKLRFSGPFPPGRSDPILSTGRSGAGDLLFIRFDGQGHFQIGHDHWGYSMVLSEPQPFDPARPIELTVAMGSLLPPADNPAYRDSEKPARVRNHLFVATTDSILLDQSAKFHPAPADSRAIGWNRIGSSSAAELLSADVLDCAAVPLETILSLLPPP
ncbi:MAG: glycosyltransferase family 39 protein [Verrucomicrobiota bacterium]